ncbi:MAG TPA: DUF4012 domain-containing protein [Acidimicrobiales bacterium]|nr:DUF4012 domain-containing protein [Acidimicrobiales bacterium]
MRGASPGALVPTSTFVAAVAAASAVGAAVSGVGPTGSVVSDVVLAGLLGAAMVGAGLRAGPAACVVGGVVAVVSSGGSSPAAVAGGAALGLSAAVLAAGRAAPVLPALSAAGLAQAALRLEWPAPTGTSALVAAGVLAPVLLTGLARSSAATRRIVARATAASIVLSAVAAGLGLAGALGARSSVDEGVHAARDGLRAAEQADRAVAADRFGRAASAFEKADRSIGAWWTRPALAVPFVGQHARALRTLAGAGADLAGAGARAAREADPDSLRLSNGGFDLRALERVRAPLEAAMASLVRSRRSLGEARSPWLVTPVADRVDELTERVRSASDRTGTAVLALRNAPALLGGDGPRRYFIAVQNPAEARASGGLIGNWGELVAEDGHLALGRFGRTQELNTSGTPSARRISGPADYVRRYAPFKPNLYWQTVTMSPDFPSVAQVIAELYPQSGGAPVDGVISLDPFAFAALLRLTGPVSVEGGGEQLTAENAPRLLLHDQYVRFGESAEAERVDFLDVASRTVFLRLTSTTLPSPRKVADALAPAVAGRHLQLASTHPAEQRFFERIGAAGVMPPVRGDFVGVVTQNFDGNKIDWFLHRAYSYDAEFDPATGDVSATLEVQLRNDAPTDGLPRSVIGFGGFAAPGQPQTAFGENLLLLSVYSPLELRTMTVDDGQVLQVSRQNELGRRVYSALVSVQSMSTRTVTLQMRGRIRSGDYSADVLRQPTVTPDQATLSVSLAPGWRVRVDEAVDTVPGTTASAPGSASATVTMDRPRTFRVGADRPLGGLLNRLRRGR